MKASNYIYIAHTEMYGTLYGMYSVGTCSGVSLRDAEEIAMEEAGGVVDSYDCILEAIHDDLNERFGYEDTPSDPSEEYLDELEEAIAEERFWEVWEITELGLPHTKEMEEDFVDNWGQYLLNGWIKNPYL